MLVISRKKDEQIVVAGEIEITILQVGRSRVKVGINAPRHMPIQTHVKARTQAEVVAARLPSAEPLMLRDIEVAQG
jgi:carbon storage regulator CsrA